MDSAAIRAFKQTRLLVIPKPEFNECPGLLASIVNDGDGAHRPVLVSLTAKCSTLVVRPAMNCDEHRSLVQTLLETLLFPGQGA